jgi:phage shock protein PspC (stress-responsive transcriptional regulator)
MHTVIIVNLNGNAFHIEEPGYASLRAYLDAASAQLKDNPDKSEIMADLEQAIADKCGHYLRPHKNVLSVAEIDTVLKEMGPVQTDASHGGGDPDPAQRPSSGADSSTAGAAPRRLYQIREGAMLSGVCTGIAAYLNVDVTVIRIAFVVLTLLTGGLWIIAYMVMMLVIPFAHTDEERAAAAGAPFNAQEVIDRARKHYSQFKNDREWRQHFRQQRREWRRRWHDGAYWWAHNLQRNVHQFSTQTTYFAQVFTGLMIPLFAVIRLMLFCLFIVALVTLTTTGALWGVPLTPSLPLWVAALLLCLVYGLIASPLHFARRAVYLQRGAYQQACFAAGDGLLSACLFALVAWVAYTHVPQVHDFIQHFPENMQIIWNNVVQSFHRAAGAGSL